MKQKNRKSGFTNQKTSCESTCSRFRVQNSLNCFFSPVEEAEEMEVPERLPHDLDSKIVSTVATIKPA